MPLADAGHPPKAEDAAVEGLGGVEVGGVEGGFEDSDERPRFGSGFSG